MTNPLLRERRHFLVLALISPFVLAGCNSSGDGTHIEIGEATKAEVRARAEGYKARALLKKKKGVPKG
jgi:hypothetical protein